MLKYDELYKIIDCKDVALLVAKRYFEHQILIDVVYTRSIGRLDKNLYLISICKNI